MKIDSFFQNINNVSCQIKKLTRPLKEFLNISYFSYQSIDTKGNYHSLSDRPDWTNFYVEQNLILKSTLLRHPRFHETGLYILSDSGAINWVMPCLRKFSIGNTIIFMEKGKDQVELFGFSAYTEEKNSTERLLQDQLLLKKYCPYFKKKSAFLLKEQEPLNLTNCRGEDFVSGSPIFSPSNKTEQLKFLSTIDKTFTYELAEKLTSREKDCLYLLSQGYFMINIGRELKLSPRTIEHYLENCKNKLSIYSREDLIQFANTLKETGFLK